MSEPFTDLPLEKEGYDVVMVNWTFDHAETDEMLESMWRTTSSFTKSGGKLISIRMADPRAKAAEGGKYGARNAVASEEDGEKFCAEICSGTSDSVRGVEDEAS